MIIKLDTSVFRFAKSKVQTEDKIISSLTKAQWINADRIVMAAMFAATIAGAILFN